MKFNYAHAADETSLNPMTVRVMRMARDKARDAGLAVQFVNEVGNLDEWSFAKRDSLEAFTAGLAGKGRAFAISAQR